MSDTQTKSNTWALGLLVGSFDLALSLPVGSFNLALSLPVGSFNLALSLPVGSFNLAAFGSGTKKGKCVLT